MKKFIAIIVMCVMCCGVSFAANGGEVIKTVAKCAVYPESILEKEYINAGKDVRVTFVLVGGSTVRTTIKAKEYLRFITKEAAYDLALLSDKTVVMRPTLARQPR